LERPGKASSTTTLANHNEGCPQGAMHPMIFAVIDRRQHGAT
jgi:hypothetical protein